MIFQAWVMSRCDGKPTEAFRRIEAYGPIDRSRVYRALRKPVAFPVRLARLIVEASDGACTMAELIDAELIAKSFVWTNPDLKRRGLEYALIRAAKRRESRIAARARVDADIAAIDIEIAALEAQIAAIADAVDPPARAAAG